MANYQLNVKVNGVEQSISTIGELEQALAATKEELRGLEIGSDAFNELTSQARNLQGELERSFEKATNFNSSLTVITESVGRLGSTVAAGFSLAISSIQLLGDESEELSEAQVKAQQALAIAFSATTIATNASTIATDAKIVADRLSLGLTNLITTAVGREAVAKAAAAASTGTATVAQLALNAAMSANPILLLVGALGALIGAFALFSDSTEDAKEETEDFNEALARTNKAIEESSKAIEDEIKLQRRLVKLRGEVAAANAKNETERLKARIETQKQLDELDLQSLDNQANNLQQQLNNIRQNGDFTTAFVTAQYEQLSKLQDFNINRALTQEQQYVARLTLQYQADLQSKQLTEEQKKQATETYYTTLFAFQEQQILNDTTLTAEERKTALERFNQAKELQRQLNLLSQERKIVVQEQAFAEQQAQEEVKRAQEKAVRDQRENLNKRKKQLEDYYDDVQKLTEDRERTILEVQRELEDFFLERISQRTEVINAETGEIIKNYDDLSDAEKSNLNIIVSNTEDIIAEYDERIKKLSVLRDREIEDAQVAFAKEIEEFRKAQEEKVKAGIISQKQLDDEIDKQVQLFNEEQSERVRIFSEQQLELERDRANKILEIDTILKNELAFGDNSLADDRASLILETIDFEIEQSQRRIENERGINTDLIVQRQKLEAEKRKLLRDSLLAQNKIELEEALKSVQGTEEQKAQQRAELIDRSNKRVKQINDRFRSEEEAAEKQNADEIAQYKIQKFQEVAQLAFQGLNAILGLAQALNELRQVETENALNELRDATATQTSILNESYNNDLANLEARFAAGLITQEQYNQGVGNLQNALDKSTQKLQSDQAKKELALKKKAFDEDKKLKIAQATIAGLQGAAQAFAGAFTLGPIAGPIVGGILAGLVAATTAVQIAAISKTKFDGGAPNVTAPNSPGGGLGGPNVGGGLPSGGGFTSFNENLVGTPQAPSTGDAQAPGQQQGFNRVYVLESDITATQQRVSVAESSATFG